VKAELAVFKISVVKIVEMGVVISLHIVGMASALCRFIKKVFLE